jgi:RNA polymerase sigma-70 factor (ECF subfamily)
MEGIAARHITYCIVPAELAGVLHDPLRRQFRREGRVEVVIERRQEDRRGVELRRRVHAEQVDERRQILAQEGRRVGDRRAPALPVEPRLELPPPAAQYAARLRFVERFVPAREYLEDQASARLVIRFQGGDPDAFALLYERYFDRVYAYLLIGLGDADAAEEGAQVTFAAALDALPDYTQSSMQSFRAWLFERAGDVAAEILTAQTGLEPLEPQRLARRRAGNAVDDPWLAAMGKLSDRELLEALEQLWPRQRQVVMLRHMLGLTNRETATVLGCSAEDALVLRRDAMAVLSENLRERFRARNASDTARVLRAFGSSAVES